MVKGSQCGLGCTFGVLCRPGCPIACIRIQALSSEVAAISFLLRKGDSKGSWDEEALGVLDPSPSPSPFYTGTLVHGARRGGPTSYLVGSFVSWDTLLAIVFCVLGYDYQ